MAALEETRDTDLRYASDGCADPDLAGYYGPGSVTWRLMAENALLLGGGRAVLMQVAHPLVAAGVAHHSTYATDPVGRLNRTLDYTVRFTFGTRADVRQAAREINQMHAAVTGKLDEATPSLPAGVAYSAQAQDLLLWVFATLVDTGMLLYPLLVGPLSQAERERYYQEGRAAIRLLGLQESTTPANLAEFRGYMRDMLAGDTLAVTESACAVARSIERLPLPPVVRPFLAVNNHITAALLPSRLRALYGYTWDRRRQRFFEAWTAGTRRLLPLLPPVARYGPWARAAWRRCRGMERSAYVARRGPRIA
jgi:uncharacterized protein (DUF2236 family)